MTPRFTKAEIAASDSATLLKESSAMLEEMAKELRIVLNDHATRFLTNRSQIKNLLHAAEITGLIAYPAPDYSKLVETRKKENSERFAGDRK